MKEVQLESSPHVKSQRGRSPCWTERSCIWPLYLFTLVKYAQMPWGMEISAWSSSKIQDEDNCVAGGNKWTLKVTSMTLKGYSFTQL